MARTTEHPVMAYMRYEARGFVTSFMTDLTNHDAAALSKRPHDECFSWIVNPCGTHIAFPHQSDCNGAWSTRFAVEVMRAMGPDNLRYFWWDGTHLVRIKCAADLDDKMAEHEATLRETAKRAHLAEMGVA
ncbi:MAG TPA: hypothetical protein VGM94_00900 [Galbitalea sp.]|jgi:hypothetical protein